MTPSLLEHPLVYKYFHTVCGTYHNCHESTALAVLDAMQQPIRKGERYLNRANQNDWIEMKDCPIDIEDYHPYGLRLPDSFQTPEKKECWNETLQCSCGKIISHRSPDVRQPVPDKAVEEKIREFKHRVEHYWAGEQKRMCVTEDELRALLDLARQK